MKAKEYERELRTLHGELVAMQEWVKTSGAKVCVVFEGRDTAGKGGTIKAITERVSPRVFRVVALPGADRARAVADVRAALHAPLPCGGRGRDLRPQLVQPGGRRAGHGLLHRGAGTIASSTWCPRSRRRWSTPGILLVKYWLEVSADEQTRRLESRIDDPRKIWKLSDIDVQSYARWDDYSRARDEMFAATDTAWAPWFVAHSDDKRRARLNIITHLLSQVPYETPTRKKVVLPKRTVGDDSGEPRTDLRYIPTPY